jgi:hypothetical protein
LAPTQSSPWPQSLFSEHGAPTAPYATQVCVLVAQCSPVGQLLAAHELPLAGAGWQVPQLEALAI